jgi:phenylpropionate dioxygenase-like ring-hydroxylating dioxygenase large terminal subunit
MQARSEARTSADGKQEGGTMSGNKSLQAEAARPFPTDAEKQYPLPPSLVPAGAYTDEAQYQREIGAIFHKCWFPAMPAADVAAARDYAVWERLGQSIIVVRQDDGDIKAWHNVCQHRGARLASGAGHCASAKFRCPWHGFTYNLAGEVRGVPLRESFDPQALEGLRAPAVRTAEWGGLIWMSLAADGPDLADYLGAIGEELSFYRLQTYRPRHRLTVELGANWKMVVDAFNETWHVPFTHVDTLSGLMLWRDARLKITPPHSWMTLPVRDFTERAGPDADHRISHLCHYLAFPNTIFSCFPTHLQMWSAWPVSSTRTILDAWDMIGPPPQGVSADKWERQIDRGWTHFVSVLEEDSQVINHLGTLGTSLGFKRNIFCTAEGRLTAFHAEVKRRTS